MATKVTMVTTDDESLHLTMVIEKFQCNECKAYSVSPIGHLSSKVISPNDNFNLFLVERK